MSKDPHYVRNWLRKNRYHIPVDGFTEIVCKGCGVAFIPRSRRQIFCKKLCGGSYRARLNGHIYSVRHASKSPRSFLGTLLNHKRRADSLTLDFLCDLYSRQGGRCALTGIEMTHSRGSLGVAGTNISIDRIDSSRGYHPDNVQLVCHAANQIKWNRTLPEVISWCRAIVDHYNRGL